MSGQGYGSQAGVGGVSGGPTLVMKGVMKTKKMS